MLDEKERLAALEREVLSMKELLMRMDNKMDNWHQNYVPRREIQEKFNVVDMKMAAIDKRLATVESNLQWLWRALTGAVIGGIASLIFLQFK